MKTLTVDGIYVTASDELPQEEIQQYVSQMREHYLLMKSMTVKLDGEFVEIEIHTNNKPFERLRRITGYLVGSMPRWNDAKRAEEHDRVKHSLEE